MTDMYEGIKAGLEDAVAKRGKRYKTETVDIDRKSTRLNSSHTDISRMPSSAWKKKKKKKKKQKTKKKKTKKKNKKTQKKKRQIHTCEHSNTLKHRT